jgi:hypothetical protein
MVIIDRRVAGPTSPPLRTVTNRVIIIVIVTMQICNNYGGMWNDRAFLSYGYLQHEDPPQLMGIDRHDYNPDEEDNNIWSSNNMFLKPLPEFTAGE